ncbi:hypothetical protein GCK72_022116 [Caenorhabditis remanei]|uniref:Uncharacterized protein n=1 Tax=Caenorhabditis remanei TaxID=31234 RepID=A0A6A5FT23_CAERE|nr:hypothetical protein GCK72_022116 [Caenorhabditis remanei]KAF1745669.1 hypothetical protein GCK72_022116 [Caenorhabditis remanei]
MDTFRKIFGLGCMPHKENLANFTSVYGPEQPEIGRTTRKRPAILSSTFIEEPGYDAHAKIQDATHQCLFPPFPVELQAKAFIKRRLEELKNNVYEKDLLNMYEVLSNCMTERVALHIASSLQSVTTTQEAFEKVLLENYMTLLKKTEWNVDWSAYHDLTDHPHFAQFYKCQLKSDFNYNKNSHELFMRMQCFLKSLFSQFKALGHHGNKNFYSMLKLMKKEFNEFVARDLLVLYYHTESSKGTKNMESYLMAKYSFERYNPIPENMDVTAVELEDAEVKSHPFYVEYFLAKEDLKNTYSFKYDRYFSCYKQVASDWIYFRRTVRDGVHHLPQVVDGMYTVLDEQLTSFRAYDLFIISQYRMDMDKIRRMEAYLSEKYRPYLHYENLPEVEAGYQAETETPSFFAKNFPKIEEIVMSSRLINSVYTQEMVSTVFDMLRQKSSELSEKQEDGRTRRHAKLLKFLHDRPNEERVRELYAMFFYKYDKWEDAFYQKYRMDIKLLKNFEVVEKFSIFENY